MCLPVARRSTPIGGKCRDVDKKSGENPPISVIQLWIVAAMVVFFQEVDLGIPHIL